MKKPLVLMILDGWGIREDAAANAIAAARTPVLSGLMQRYPRVAIQTSGMAVGLPEGQMGNSEVGHLNLGAGRIVYQDLTRITKAIADGDFFSNPVLVQSMSAVKKLGGTLHLAGLLSDGGVHSHNTHLYALIRMAQKLGVEHVAVHALLDGRDTPPQSALGYLKQLEEELAAIGLGRITTVSGRFYGMDRDNRWDRVEKAYRAWVSGDAVVADSAIEAITTSYAQGVTDEFVLPTCIRQADGTIHCIADGDAMIFFNFRSDRAREITRALTQEPFDGFVRESFPSLSSFVCMTEYDATFSLPVAFEQEALDDLLGEVLSTAGLQQLRIAETEKYAHVTFFFNGGIEEPFPGEDRVLIPSPKDVATYDLKPEMSASAVAAEACRRLALGTYDVVILNFANCDMVGHTGILDAAVQAVEAVDRAVGEVVAETQRQGGIALITADHGNAEQMLDEHGEPHTAHTCNPVWFVLVGEDRIGTALREGGRLADVAPTMLELLGLTRPAAMTGESLLCKP